MALQYHKRNYNCKCHGVTESSAARHKVSLQYAFT